MGGLVVVVEEEWFVMRVFLRFSFPLLGPFVFPLRLLLSYLLFFS